MQHNIATLATCNPTVLDRGVREAECALLTGVSRAQRWKLEKDGRFPKRRRTGLRSHYWLLSELMLWLNDPEGYSIQCAETSATSD